MGPSYSSGLTVQMLAQPALDVYFWFLEGDRLYLGTTGTVQIELKDRQGEYFNPTGDIIVSVYPVDDQSVIASNPTVVGVASQEVMDGVPYCGRYFFEFDTSGFTGSLRALVRASIPYRGSTVLWQRTVQFEDPASLS
jgi:hypothetical protein